MLLERKNAIIYGGGGAIAVIGSAVARVFAAEGARVYLADVPDITGSRATHDRLRATSTGATRSSRTAATANVSCGALID